MSILALRPCTTAHTGLDPAFFALAALTLRGGGSGGGSRGRGNGTRDHSGGGGLQVSSRCQQMRLLNRGGGGTHGGHRVAQNGEGGAVTASRDVDAVSREREAAAIVRVSLIKRCESATR